MREACSFPRASSRCRCVFGLSPDFMISAKVILKKEGSCPEACWASLETSAAVALAALTGSPSRRRSAGDSMLGRFQEPESDRLAVEDGETPWTASFASSRARYVWSLASR